MEEPFTSDASWKLVEQTEEINKKILSTRSERVKRQLRERYTEKYREVKRSIKVDKRKWMENIADGQKKLQGANT